MIQIIVFSFDRALQLEALLSSIRRYWTRTAYRLTVIYNTSGDEFERGYTLLKKGFPDFQFVKETRSGHLWHTSDYLRFFNLKKILHYPNLRNQRSDFRDLLLGILSDSSAPYTMFLTDDSVFIRDVVLSDKTLSFIDEDVAQNQISLRLGKGVSACPSDIPVQDGCLVWHFHRYPLDTSWGYRFSVDAHIYATSLIRQLFRRVIFNNPNTLEGIVCHYVRTRKLLDKGLTFEDPFILSFPLNRVQDVADNKSLGVSVTFLNELYLDGKRLEIALPDDIREFQQYPSEVRLVKDGKVETLRIQ